MEGGAVTGVLAAALLASLDPPERRLVAEQILVASFGATAVARAGLSQAEAEAPWTIESAEYGTFTFYAANGGVVAFRHKSYDAKLRTRRDPSYLINDPASARELTDPVGASLGDWVYTGCRLEDDRTAQRQPRMERLGTATCTYLRKSEPRYLVHGNRLEVCVDRADGQLLSVTLVTVFRPRLGAFELTAQDARRRAESHVASWKDETARRISDVEAGYCHDEHALVSPDGDSWNDVVDSVPAYRVFFSDEQASFVVVSARDGSVLVDGRQGRR